jgi:hypothetical protein
MIGIVIMVLALALAYPVKQAIDTTRSDSSGDFTGLNCSSPPDNYYRAACLISDATIPYFIVGLIALGGSVIGAKVFFQ